MVVLGQYKDVRFSTEFLQKSKQKKLSNIPKHFSYFSNVLSAFNTLSLLVILSDRETLSNKVLHGDFSRVLTNITNNPLYTLRKSFKYVSMYFTIFSFLKRDLLGTLCKRETVTKNKHAVVGLMSGMYENIFPMKP